MPRKPAGRLPSSLAWLHGIGWQSRLCCAGPDARPAPTPLFLPGGEVHSGVHLLARTTSPVSLSNPAGTISTYGGFHIMNKRIESLLTSIQSAFRTPTLKQKEAYGRYSHTISAACCIGAVTIGFSESSATANTTEKVTALVFWAVVLFLVGSILSKGE